LECLTFVEGNLSIDFNDQLIELEGIDRLQSVGGGVGISQNPSLESLHGLRSLSQVGGHYISIENNRSLPACEVEELVERIRSTGWDGDVTMDGNDELAPCD
jgi:hypothetical protein